MARTLACARIRMHASAQALTGVLTPTQTLNIDARNHMHACAQTSTGTPGTDYPIPNPALVNTKVCYGLTAAALTSSVVAYKEVRFGSNLMHVPQQHGPSMRLLSHVRSCEGMQTCLRHC